MSEWHKNKLFPVMPDHGADKYQGGDYINFFNLLTIEGMMFYRMP